MYKLNDISFEIYGILPGRIQGEGIAVKGIFDLPKRIGDIEHTWDDSDSVQPFVALDEIFLGARDITFQGIIIGTETLIKSYLTAFKSAISAFVATVPFETPYGTVCVYVKKFDVKHYNGGAIIEIQFVEPVTGAVCGVNIPPSVYYSAAYSGTSPRNNCEDGYFGSDVTLIAVAGQFTSTVNQAAANQLAVDWVLENIQDYANVNGTCTINPTIYYNTKLSGSLEKECDSGYEGSTVTYTVEAYKYQSLVSQTAVDAMAQNELDTNLTQEYANTKGVCKLIYYNEHLVGTIQKDDCADGYIGSIEEYNVHAGAYSSTLSQAYANALAQVAFNTRAQNYANTFGSCGAHYLPGFTIEKIRLVSTTPTSDYLCRLSGQIVTGNRYAMRFKALNEFKLEYIAVPGDNFLNVLTGLAAVVTNTTQTEWSTLAGTFIKDIPFVRWTSDTGIKIEIPRSNVMRLKDVWVSR